MKVFDRLMKESGPVQNKGWGYYVKRYDHDWVVNIWWWTVNYTIMIEIIQSWLKVYDQSRKMNDHLLKNLGSFIWKYTILRDFDFSNRKTETIRSSGNYMIIQKITHKAFTLTIKVPSPHSCLNSTLEVVRIFGPRFIGPKIVSGTRSVIRV